MVQAGDKNISSNIPRLAHQSTYMFGWYRMHHKAGLRSGTTRGLQQLLVTRLSERRESLFYNSHNIRSGIRQPRVDNGAWVMYYLDRRISNALKVPKES
jgi:hypothetical protein